MSLKLDRISKRYGNNWILRDISFEISPGEILGLCGAPSDQLRTVLDIASGKQLPTTGKIFVDGHDVTKSQDGSIVAPGSASRSFFQRLFKRRSQTLDENMMALNYAIDNPQRALLLYEPFCGLDIETREAYLDRIRKLAREQSTAVLIATSNYDLILDACDRAHVLVNGESRQTGTPEQIYERPESRTVASISGRNNLIAARRLTSSKADVPEFHTIDGGHRLFAQRVDRGSLGALNQNVTLAIRPENISISFGASFPADNLLKAKVTRVKFLGATTLIGLDADGLGLEAQVLRLVGLNVGDECMVGLPPERIIILRD